MFILCIASFIFFSQNVDKVNIEVNEYILFLSDISLIIILLRNEDNESVGCL